MDAYFCAGMYHIFNCINIKLGNRKDIDGDLYIFDCFNGAKEIAERLKKHKIFTNVYLIKNNPTVYNFKIEKKISKFQILKNLYARKLNKDDYKNEIFITKKYDEVFCVGFYCYLHKYFNSQNFKINFYDEGLSNRTKSFFYYPKFFSLHNLFHVRNYEKRYKALYNYGFENIINNFKKEKIIIKEQFSKNKELFYDIFNVDQNDVKKFNKAKIILLTSGFEMLSGMSGSKELSKKENELYNKIIKKYKNEVLVKMHPNSKDISFDCPTIKTRVPFELFCSKSIESKVIISAFSSSVFNLTFVYNYQPKVVFTIKLLDVDTKVWFYEDENTVLKMIDNQLSSCYKKKSDVLIAEDYNEVEKFLQEK